MLLLPAAARCSLEGAGMAKIVPDFVSIEPIFAGDSLGRFASFDACLIVSTPSKEAAPLVSLNPCRM